ncbi:MAG: Hpt domain-containing protein [Deltaproteobacteria bacterium]|nr:Hpt domain-containing protein [Deltaproteobacteria bacterium]
MNSDIDNEVREEFKRDFLDQLQEVERLLLKLEGEPQNLDYIRDIFRPFHTIKGNAGVIGEKEIQDISQLSETLLDQARSGWRTLTGDMIEIIFQSVDLIRSIVESGAAQPFAGKIEQLKALLQSAADSDLKKSTVAPGRRSSVAAEIEIDYDTAIEILKHIVAIDRETTQCKIDRSFEPHLFDLFDHVLALALFFEKSVAVPAVTSLLKYLECYLTVLNTCNIQYGKEAWELLAMINADIMKLMYGALVAGMNVGICYFNPEDTTVDLDNSLKWLIKSGKKAIIININRNKAPKLEEIRGLMALKKSSDVPIAYIQRFFGHKMYWRDMELLMGDSFTMETSFWRALESFVN